MRAFSCAVLVVMGCSGAAVARDNCEVWPRFEPAALKLATVKASVKRSRFDEADGAYVVGGDELVVAESDGDMACAVYVNGKGVATEGWLKAADLEISSLAPLPAKAWAGHWTAGTWHHVEIKPGRTPGWIVFSGEAAWAASDEAAATGGINEGGIGGEAPIENGVAGATYSDDGVYRPFDEKASDSFVCAVRLRVLSRRYLMVEDNRNCGGANVSSTGFYVRQK